MPRQRLPARAPEHLATLPEATGVAAAPVAAGTPSPRAGQARAPPSDHFALALYYQRVGDFNNALAQYRMLLEQNDASAEVHNNLGLLYQDRGNVDDAVREFRRAIALDPTLRQGAQQSRRGLLARGTTRRRCR